MEEARGVPWSSQDDGPPAAGPPTTAPPAGAGPGVAVEQAIRRVAGPEAKPNDAPGCGCDDCVKDNRSEEFVYALGRLEARFPSIGVEREFTQRVASMGGDPAAPRGARLRSGLEGNLHLARRMCYLLMVGGAPAYVVSPAGSYLLPAVLEAVERIGQEGSWCLVIGRRGPMSSPGSCGGVTAPVVVCDQLYAFTEDEWGASLERQLEPVFTAKRVVRKDFGALSRNLFHEFVQSTENIGASDAHRAVNYLLMQHPGLFLAAAERAGRQRLDRIETRSIHGLGLRRLVGVIASFVDPTTGVPERLFTRVDVTEEWPFVADTADGRPAPIGLLPFVDNALVGAMY